MEIESMSGRKVFLDLRVKVDKGLARRRKRPAPPGYKINKKKK